MASKQRKRCLTSLIITEINITTIIKILYNGKKLKIWLTNNWSGCGKLELSYTDGGSINWYNRFGKYFGILAVSSKAEGKHSLLKLPQCTGLKAPLTSLPIGRSPLTVQNTAFVAVYRSVFPYGPATLLLDSRKLAHKCTRIHIQECS